MAHADFQTPVGEIAPYIARQTEVPTGTDAGTLKVLLRAPPNANVQLVCLSAYGAWGLNILPYVYLIPPAGSTELAVGSPNSYCLFSHAGDLGRWRLGQVARRAAVRPPSQPLGSCIAR